MKKIILFAMLALAIGVTSHAATYEKLRFADEATDTVRINELLIEAISKDFKTSGDCIAWFADKFVGVPYCAGSLEGEAPDFTEYITVNLGCVDCTTLVDMAVALAYTVGERRSSWRDFVYNLERIRYRNGNANGYPSRLHYFSDWVIDNTHRDNLKEVTSSFPAVHYQVKSIDFMSAHRDKYPAMVSSENYEGIKNSEIGYRNHRFPYIKPQNVGSKATRAAFKNGDVVAFTTKLQGLDVAHLGIVVMVDGQPRLLHASSSAGKVVLTDFPLEDMFRKNRNFTGLRVVRLKDW